MRVQDSVLLTTAALISSRITIARATRLSLTTALCTRMSGRGNISAHTGHSLICRRHLSTIEIIHFYTIHLFNITVPFLSLIS